MSLSPLKEPSRSSESSVFRLQMGQLRDDEKLCEGRPDCVFVSAGIFVKIRQHLLSSFMSK